jgi:FkbM family methyltransferase
MKRVTGDRLPSTFESRLAHLRFRLRNRLAARVIADDGTDHFVFRCESPMEEYRALTFFVKEEGTIRWIRSSVRPGEVFCDVGANIGLYTLLAARLIGPEGVVYAFEPHAVNLQSLLHNVSANGFADRVRVVSCAVNDREAFLDFNYQSWMPGSSMSQLGGSRDADGRPFVPVASEYKFGCSLDFLVRFGHMRPPHHVKIDVDGNELLVLRGMQELLSGPAGPRTVQVECNLGAASELQSFMDAVGFEQVERHDTYGGKQAIARGVDPAKVAHNLVFRRKSSHQSSIEVEP